MANENKEKCLVVSKGFIILTGCSKAVLRNLLPGMVCIESNTSAGTQESLRGMLHARRLPGQVTPEATGPTLNSGEKKCFST